VEHDSKFDGKVWLTSEALFQSMRYDDVEKTVKLTTHFQTKMTTYFGAN
jgi:hypothetical protein